MESVVNKIYCYLESFYRVKDKYPNGVITATVDRPVIQRLENDEMAFNWYCLGCKSAVKSIIRKAILDDLTKFTSELEHATDANDLYDLVDDIRLCTGEDPVERK